MPSQAGDGFLEDILVPETSILSERPTFLAISSEDLDLLLDGGSWDLAASSMALGRSVNTPLA